MIDTLRFKIKTTPKLISQVQKLSVSLVKKSNITGITLYSGDKVNVKLPSWDYNTNLFFSEIHPNYLFLELSIPKYEFGHNLYLIYPDELSGVIQDLYVYLNRSFDLSLPPIDTWQVVRADFCYSWRYHTQLQAQAIMGILQTYNFPRKKVHRTNSSIMYVGSTYSVKYYLKSNEFFAHDFKRIVKTDPDNAYRLLNISDGILRFEITMRSKALFQYFDVLKCYIKDISDTHQIESIMNQIQSKLLGKVQKNGMTNAEVLDQLMATFPPKKAFNLWKYYLLARGTDFFVRQKVNEAYHRSQVYRLQSDLVRAGVGISIPDSTEKYDLMIPSKFAVNPRPVTRERDGLRP
jgi:hypothetical protein